MEDDDEEEEGRKISGRSRSGHSRTKSCNVYCTAKHVAHLLSGHVSAVVWICFNSPGIIACALHLDQDLLLDDSEVCFIEKRTITMQRLSTRHVESKCLITIRHHVVCTKCCARSRYNSVHLPFSGGP